MIEVVNESGEEADELALEDVAKYVLARLGIHPLAELSVLLVDESAMTELHEKWMDEPGPTDVLSFPMVQADLIEALSNDDGEQLLGDIVLAAETVAREADEKGTSLANHATHLIVHGTLHLLGYDHERDDEAERMEQLERTVLEGLGLPDPYVVRES